MKKQVIIIGGGLAGLVTAVQLSKKGISCILIEKKEYPFHRVCGEYVSFEVEPFLRSLSIFPDSLAPAYIQRFQLSSARGKTTQLPLDLGGFGISRFAFDEFIYLNARQLGVTFLLNHEAENITFHDNKFIVKTKGHDFEADIVIGAHGKRSKLDTGLNRAFISNRSPYVGVKYHIRTDHPSDLIALHNFAGGYCGMSNVENGITNLCYLVHRDQVRKYGNLKELEQNVLSANPLLKQIFADADFLFERPETVNEISFAAKSPVEDHLLMVGDAAGMIAPLCGNGMAMAMRGSKLLCDLVLKFFSDRSFTRMQLEKCYASQWKQLFASRLWRGRQIQRLFGSVVASNIAVNLALHVKPVARAIMKQTHGDPFA